MKVINIMVIEILQKRSNFNILLLGVMICSGSWLYKVAPLHLGYLYNIYMSVAWRESHHEYTSAIYAIYIPFTKHILFHKILTLTISIYLKYLLAIGLVSIGRSSRIDAPRLFSPFPLLTILLS